LLENTTKVSLDRLDSALSTPLRAIWRCAAQCAVDRGWDLYLVGGAVRDLLLQNSDAALSLPDLDLVVGGETATPTDAGIQLAADLQEIYPQAKLTSHPNFQTAALTWPQMINQAIDSSGETRRDWSGTSVDIATARIETYEYPGAHPTVTAGSIYQDLQRRDFTVNALALRLTGERAGEIIDFFGGQQDLVKKSLRVLHDLSLQDDPTRIFRGVRFLTRLGFNWATETIEQWQTTLHSSIFVATLATQTRVPSLEDRLRAELKYLSDSPQWLAGIRELSELQAWQCIHPHLQISEINWLSLNLVEKLLANPAPGLQLTAWPLRLEIILASLDLLDRDVAARQLQMPQESIDRLLQIEAVRSTIDSLPFGLRPSQIAAKLSVYSIELLHLVLLLDPEPDNRLLYLYLTDWSQTVAWLDGNDLQDLGYPPGKAYKHMLQTLAAATCDGLVRDRESSIEFIKTNFKQT
jgi:tRNA nucleotidyltransferase (CCA-adding enzyme)